MDIKNILKEFRKIGAVGLYNNILWWAKGNHRISEESVKKAFTILDDLLLTKFRNEFVVEIPKNTFFYRARNIEIDDYTKKEKGILCLNGKIHGYNWENSKEPPKDYSKAGRTSYKGCKALYLAADEITACMEVRTPIKGLVSVAKFELQRTVSVLDFSKLKYSQPLDVYDEKYDIDVRHFLSHILNLFTYPIYDNNYIVTQKIVEHFRNIGIKGFIYRSLYTGKNNYTFFDEYRKLFNWKDSRVLINYATANLFVSVDDGGENKDISNCVAIEKEVSKEIRQNIFKDVKVMFNR